MNLSAVAGSTCFFTPQVFCKRQPNAFAFVDGDWPFNSRRQFNSNGHKGNSMQFSASGYFGKLSGSTVVES